MAGLKPPQVPESLIPLVPDDLMRKVLDGCQGRDFISRSEGDLMRLNGWRSAQMATSLRLEILRNCQILWITWWGAGRGQHWVCDGWRRSGVGWC
jgi:hypothetical protein